MSLCAQETIKGLRDKLNAAEVAKEAALEREQKSTTAAQVSHIHHISTQQLKVHPVSWPQACDQHTMRAN